MLRATLCCFLACGLAAMPAGVAAEEDYLARGNEASAALFGRLMTTLQNKIEKDGVESAIAFCRLEALPLTEETARPLAGVKSLRRIGVRTRNPGNMADEVDREVLAQFLRDWEPAAPSGPVLRTVESPRGENEVRFYRPVPVAASCLACHGAKELMAPNVVEAIEAQYPADEAVDFREGDLRGAIVVTFDGGGETGDTSP